MRMLDVKKVCHKVCIGKTTLYEMIKKGMFPRGYGDGRYHRWLESEIDAFVIFFWELPSQLPEIDAATLIQIETMAEAAKAAKLNQTTAKEALYGSQ